MIVQGRAHIQLSLEWLPFSRFSILLVTSLAVPGADDSLRGVLLLVAVHCAILARAVHDRRGTDLMQALSDTVLGVDGEVELRLEAPVAALAICDGTKVSKQAWAL